MFKNDWSSNGKEVARSSFDTLNQRDLAKVTADLTEDGTWTFPGNVPISGETKGKKAIEAAMANWMAHYPQINFTVKEVFVFNIFAMGATNNIAVEWAVWSKVREVLNDPQRLAECVDAGLVELEDMATIKFERLEGAIFKGIVAPTELGEGGDPEERQAIMTRNLRAILQLFGIKVHVFPDRVEVRGGIPTQVLDLSEPQPEPTGPIISLASPEGKGEIW